MRQQKPIKVKLIYQPDSPEEAKLRLLQAYRIILSEEDIRDFLKSKQNKDVKKPRTG